MLCLCRHCFCGCHAGGMWKLVVRLCRQTQQCGFSVGVQCCLRRSGRKIFLYLSVASKQLAAVQMSTAAS